MSNEELLGIREVLHDAKFEIQQLRRANEILAAKVEVLDLLAPLIRTNHFLQPTIRMAPDVAHALEVALKIIAEAEINANLKAKPECRPEN
jgi:hypothetical protein